MELSPSQIFALTMFGLTLIFGISGNVFLISKVLGRKEMESIVNILITVIAISDLLYCFIGIPSTIVSFLSSEWNLGGLMCKLGPASAILSVLITSLSNSVIATLRHRAVLYPFKPELSKRSCLLIVFFIWVFALIISGIQFAVRRLEDQMCIDIWPSENVRLGYYGFVASLQFGVPAVVTGICYLKIFLRLQEHRRMPSISSQQSGDREVRDKKINAMLFLMIVVFIVCWFPYTVCMFTAEVKLELWNQTWFFTTVNLLYAVATSSVVWNPILCIVMNARFRRLFIGTVKCESVT